YEMLTRPTAPTTEEPDLSFGLEHYPNPVSGSATIEYGLPLEGDVTIVLYDMLGRRIRTLEDRFHEPGPHRYTFSTNDLAGGHYYYVMTIGSQFIARRRMVVGHR
ncbi:MAG TPA: T9SS type A sorting domain-containing protein, partial [Rhodothermales bacterium]|nr:T9SS type A sorting domain-containing protein [Rhodothermales bacterium]